MKRFLTVSVTVCALCVLPLALLAFANQTDKGVVQALQQIIPASTSRKALANDALSTPQPTQFTKPPSDSQPDQGAVAPAAASSNLQPWQQQLQQCVAGYSLISLASVVQEIAPTVLAVSTEAVVTSPSRPSVPGPGGGDLFEDFFRFFGQPQREQQPSKRHVEGWGTAFVISADETYGVLALTNHHVIEKADTIKVKAYDRRVYNAELVGSHEDTDVALLRIKSDHLNWKVLPFAQTPVQVGDRVIAMGNTLALGTTASEGIVSGLGRSKVFPSGRKGLFNFTQITAPISPGNSGGPCIRIDLDASCKPKMEIIGMNTAMSASGQNVGFSIPADEILEPVYKQLRNPPHKVVRSWMGVVVSEVDWKLAKNLGIDPPHGALIHEVVPKGPADKAGIRPGDVVLRFDGKMVRDDMALPVAASLKGVDKTVPVIVFREGSNPPQLSLTLTLGKRPENDELELASANPGATIHIPSLGIWVTDGTEALPKWHLQELGIPENVKGARVVKVSREAKNFLKGKETIIKVNRRVISSARELKKVVDSIKPGEPLHLRLFRGNSLAYYFFSKPAEPAKEPKRKK
ncbi:MAG: trypsin-like peptidase domain-containing protein [Myxococcota bacterium]